MESEVSFGEVAAAELAPGGSATRVTAANRRAPPAPAPPPTSRRRRPRRGGGAFCEPPHDRSTKRAAAPGPRAPGPPRAAPATRAAPRRAPLRPPPAAHARKFTPPLPNFTPPGPSTRASTRPTCCRGAWAASSRPSALASCAFAAATRCSCSGGQAFLCVGRVCVCVCVLAGTREGVASTTTPPVKRPAELEQLVRGCASRLRAWQTQSPATYSTHANKHTAQAGGAGAAGLRLRQPRPGVAGGGGALRRRLQRGQRARALVLGGACRAWRVCCAFRVCGGGQREGRAARGAARPRPPRGRPLRAPNPKRQTATHHCPRRFAPRPAPPAAPGRARARRAAAQAAAAVHNGERPRPHKGPGRAVAALCDHAQRRALRAAADGAHGARGGRGGGAGGCAAARRGPSCATHAARCPPRSKVAPAPPAHTQ